MMDHRTQYIIHKEKENDLMHQIERKLAAQERGGYAQTTQTWISAAEQWLKEKVFFRRPAENPCPEESPC
jgi:hypothetical protein